MTKLVTSLLTSSLLLTGTLVMAQGTPKAGQPGSAPKANAEQFNQKATNLFIDYAKNGKMTAEMLKKFHSKKANINVMYKNESGITTNLFLDTAGGFKMMPSRKFERTEEGVFIGDPWDKVYGVFATLIELGADPMVIDSNGRNAVTIITQNSSVMPKDFCLFLFDNLHKELHVPIDLPDKKGITPLMYALCADNLLFHDDVFKIIKFFVESGANVNASTQSVTVLMFAVSQSTAETVKYLIEHGAKVSAKDKEGHTVLDYAKDNQSSDREKILKLLNEKMLDDL